MSQALLEFRVLVADDDRVIAKTMSQILRLSGYETDTVCSGEEAVTVAAKTRPDVFISDVLMAGITGIEAAIRILKILPGCRVILISGHANTANQLDDARRDRFLEVSGAHELRGRLKACDGRHLAVHHPR